MILSQLDALNFGFKFISASPTRRLCMEYNRKNIAAKLNPSGDNADYQEESDNEIEDDDTYAERENFTDVRESFYFRRERIFNFLEMLLDLQSTGASHLRQFFRVLLLSMENREERQREAFLSRLLGTHPRLQSIGLHRLRREARGRLLLLQH